MDSEELLNWIAKQKQRCDMEIDNARDARDDEEEQYWCGKLTAFEDVEDHVLERS